MPAVDCVDHDLAVLRPDTLDEGEAVERRLRRVDAEAEVRRAAEGDRLAVVADQLGVAADAADRLRDVRQGLHLGEHATRRTAAPTLPLSFRSNAVLPVIVASVPR